MGVMTNLNENDIEQLQRYLRAQVVELYAHNSNEWQQLINYSFENNCGNIFNDGHGNPWFHPPPNESNFKNSLMNCYNYEITSLCKRLIPWLKPHEITDIVDFSSVYSFEDFRNIVGNEYNQILSNLIFTPTPIISMEESKEGTGLKNKLLKLLRNKK